MSTFIERLEEEIKTEMNKVNLLKAFLRKPDCVSIAGEYQVRLMKKQLVIMELLVNILSERYENVVSSDKIEFAPSGGEQLIGSFNSTNSDEVTEIKVLASYLCDSIYNNVLHKDARRANAGITQIEFGTMMAIKGLFN